MLFNIASTFQHVKLIFQLFSTFLSAPLHHSRRNIFLIYHPSSTLQAHFLTFSLFPAHTTPTSPHTHTPNYLHENYLELLSPNPGQGAALRPAWGSHPKPQSGLPPRTPVRAAALRPAWGSHPKPRSGLLAPNPRQGWEPCTSWVRLTPYRLLWTAK